MDLLISTFALRPYVLGFVAACVLAAVRDLGWPRRFVFAAWVAPLAWLSEFTSTRIGIPFGLYQYTQTTRDRELFMLLCGVDRRAGTARTRPGISVIPVAEWTKSPAMEGGSGRV